MDETNLTNQEYQIIATLLGQIPLVEKESRLVNQIIDKCKILGNKIN